jgi:hypothetical protein
MSKILNLPVVKKDQSFDSSKLSNEELWIAIRMIDAILSEMEGVE